MTETEWLRCDNSWNPWRVVEHGSDRKQRLLACAYCRGQWCIETPQLVKLIVETAERQADGLVDWEEVVATQERAERELWDLGTRVTTQALSLLYEPVYKACRPMVEQCRFDDDGPYLARWARELFGNPLHPIDVNPSWLAWNSGIIPKLSQTIYDERRFGEMPVLGDALEEAGCTSQDILNHCRGPGPHVRGCWVLDLLLGKK